MDALRTQTPRNAHAAFQLVMDRLRPSHVDAQITADALIASLTIGYSESVPALIQRLAEYVKCLPPVNRPNEETQKKHIKRAVKKNPSAWPKYKDKIEALMDREPPLSYAQFGQGLLRKHEELVEESNQEAALNVETIQKTNHD